MPTWIRTPFELIITVALAGAAAFGIQAFLIKPYRIPSPSMVPTLAVGQRILVNRLATHPQVGDIVVFHPPSGAVIGASGRCGSPTEGFSQGGEPLSAPCDVPVPKPSGLTFVKRVVGVGGDRLKITDGHVTRNGKAEADSFTTACAGAPECTFSRTITVPEGDYYMMGDNRGNSDDSRFWGPVPRRDIIGEAFFTYWPLKRIGTL